jgi:hypothetical protein
VEKGGGQVGGRKRSFLEKTNQKPCACRGGPWIRRSPDLQKFFGSFFQKRTLPFS